VSVTIIKDLGKAVLEQDEHRKALRETATGQEAEQEIEQEPGPMTKSGSKAGEPGDHQPPAAEAGQDEPISGDSPESSGAPSPEPAPDDT
jgi:hypothetical protein